MSSKILLQNYKQTKDYLLSLQDELSISNTTFYHELVEHSLTSAYVIELIQTSKIDLELHKNKLIEELLNSKDWFYSLNYNYKELSIDTLYDDYGFELDEKSNIQIEQKDEDEVPYKLDYFKNEIDQEDQIYLETLLDKNSDMLYTGFNEILIANKKEIIERFDLIKQLFPEGFNRININDINSSDPIELFKFKFLGIIPDFPPLYFSNDAKSKIVKIIKYIQNDLKKQDIETFTKDNSIQLLYEFKIKSIARLVNYSWNKLIHIVFPKQFNPWQLGKVDHGYWDDSHHRKEAVKWIIEEYLNTNPENIWRLIKAKKYNRSLYGKLGLSYLYNTHYNSLFKSLKEAYPELPYWYFGIFPENYWNDENNHQFSKEAFRWMLIQERIDFKKLPQALRQKRLSRKTFNMYGLSTMFDYCFSRNFYELIEYSFPGIYKPWEIGNVKKNYWQDSDNQHDAIHWFLHEQDTSKKEIFKKIESKNFSKELFKRSKLANFFKTMFNNNPERVFNFFLKPKRQLLNENRRLLNRYQKESKHKIERSILNYILYGFNLPLMTYFHNQKNERLNRKKRRMKRIVQEENLK